MAHHSSQKNRSSLEERLNEIKRNSRSVEGFVTRCILNTRTIVDDGERLKRVAFGEKDRSKPHKTILLAGEIGLDKTTVINAMVNYMLGVRSEDRIWCEIIETEKYQTVSQTKAITVYDVFPAQSTFSLTIFDLHGFESTEGSKEESNFAEILNELFKSVHEFNAMCFVVSSDMAQFAERQLNIFDAAVSLFGSDAEKNIAVLITYDKTKSTNAIDDAKGPDKGGPASFRFFSVHCENFSDEEVLDDHQASWDQLNKTMESFLSFLEETESINWKVTEAVLRNRDRMTASISNIKDLITLTDFVIKELEQQKEALQQVEKEKRDPNTFECEVDKPYKEKVPLPYNWWFIRTTEAMCCGKCEENCHYPGCWWATDPSWCNVMSEGKCTVCTGKCHHTAHVKEGKIYEVKTRKVKKTMVDLKGKYKTESGEIESLVSKLENEIKEQEREKNKLVEKCYRCVVKLNEIASMSYFVSILTDAKYLDFLILKAVETGQLELVQRLEELKNTANARNQSPLERMRRFLPL